MIVTPPPLSSFSRRAPVTGAAPPGASEWGPADTPPGGEIDGWAPQSDGRPPPRAGGGAGGPRQSAGAPATRGREPELPFAEVVPVTPEMSGADRRIADRHPVRSGSRAELRRWGALAGPDVAEELIDVSETGLG